MARAIKLFFTLAASLILASCAVSSFSQQPAPKLTAGFWYWEGASIDATWSDEPLDVVFVQVGTIRTDRWRGAQRWSAFGQWPRNVPVARDYWLVYRYEKQGVPDAQVVPILGREISRLQAEARMGHLHVAGIQLDVDSPTGALPQYAEFLREVRKALPPGMQISVTALLDWFRTGTAIDQVVREADEFVPQFYDVGDPASYEDAAIAARVDAGHWGPVFNRFQKRFRVGISTFGRARMIPRAGVSSSGRFLRASLFGDVGLMDVATNPSFRRKTDRNEADELVLTYEVTRPTSIDYYSFAAGDALQFILATPESVRASAKNAREMRGFLAGVVFFRWPSSNETLAMKPEEVLAGAGFAPPNRNVKNRVELVDGHCSAVECVDVYLEGAEPFSAKTVRYRIRSSTELEYFLPEKNMPVRMTGSSQLELSLPPFCGRGRLYLGRAVTTTRSRFTVEQE